MKAFHLGDILSIITGRLLSPSKIDGVYSILNYMTGKSLYTHQLPRAGDKCKPYLLEQFPQFKGKKFAKVYKHFEELLQTPSGKEDPKNLCMGWLVEMWSGRYGIDCSENMDVQSIQEYLEAGNKKP